MTGSAGAATALMAAAARFAVRRFDPLSADQLDAATPCTGWNLRMLLLHLDDSLAALHEGLAAGAVPLRSPGGEPPVGNPDERLMASVRSRAHALLYACRSAPPAHRGVAVAQLRMPLAMLDAAGAVELTVHGWDVARTCGRDEPIPDRLAERLLLVLPAVVNDATRGDLFAPPVAVPARTRPGDRLVAMLGRLPRWGLSPERSR
jgi:uncharacterized protein (TIGR03086 family)